MGIRWKIQPLVLNSPVNFVTSPLQLGFVLVDVIDCTTSQILTGLFASMRLCVRYRTGLGVFQQYSKHQLDHTITPQYL